MSRMQLFRKFPDCSSIREIDLPVIGEGAAVDDDHWEEREEEMVQDSLHFINVVALIE